MSVLWTDGTWTSALAVGNPEFFAPIPAVTTQYCFKQRFVIFLSNYSALALDTAHPTYGSYFLVAESDLRDLGGGICEFTRTYATTPATHNEYERIAYHFIGLVGDLSTSPVTQPRLRFTRTVPMKVQYDYYQTATPSSIAIILATEYYQWAGAQWLVDQIYDAGPPALSTVPSQSDYLGWIAADAGSSTSFSIVAEASSITRWMGNIWRRETRYVKAI